MTNARITTRIKYAWNSIICDDDFTENEIIVSDSRYQSETNFLLITSSLILNICTIGCAN